jgi:uncharacterized membrane protein (UPF0127 family)
MISKTVLSSLAAMSLLACSTAESQPSRVEPRISGTPQTGLERVPLQIRSGSRTHRFTVEVAGTPDQQQTGLMFRERVAPNEGMIFPFDPPRPASFWMKNTMVPLDMLFIRGNGSIACIAVRTVPYSLASVACGEPVASVLELAGGRTVELGIHEEDTVIWQAP